MTSPASKNRKSAGRKKIPAMTRNDQVLVAFGSEMMLRSGKCWAGVEFMLGTWRVDQPGKIGDVAFMLFFDSKGCGPLSWFLQVIEVILTSGL